MLFSQYLYTGFHRPAAFVGIGGRQRNLLIRQAMDRVAVW
jgi:hypothetical protein